MCRPVTSDGVVVSYLRFRGLDAGLVAERDLAREMPSGMFCSSWARFQRRPWTDVGLRLVVPMFGADGRFESLHARNVHRDCSPGEKAGAPAGYHLRGLVFADGAARTLLAGRPVSTRLVVAEGEFDDPTWATRWSEGSDAPTVIGLVNGGWTVTIAARVPDGTEVAVHTDPDEAGRRYATAVVETLHPRCICFRPRRASL